MNQSLETSTKGRHPDANLILTYYLVGFLAFCMFCARVGGAEVDGTVLLGLAALVVGYLGIIFGTRRMSIDEEVDHLSASLRTALYIYLMVVLLGAVGSLFPPRDLGMSSELFKAQRVYTGEVPALTYAWLVVSALIFVKIGALVSLPKYWKRRVFLLLLGVMVLLDLLLDITDGGAVDVPVLGTLNLIKLLALGSILASSGRVKQA